MFIFPRIIAFMNKKIWYEIPLEICSCVQPFNNKRVVLGKLQFLQYKQQRITIKKTKCFKVLSFVTSKDAPFLRYVTHWMKYLKSIPSLLRNSVLSYREAHTCPCSHAEKADGNGPRRYSFISKSRYL